MTDSESDYSARNNAVVSDVDTSEDTERFAYRQDVLLAIMFGIAVVLRLLYLGAESLWLDEATTVVYVNRWTVTETVVQLSNVSPHPPLYFVLIKLWASVFGTDEVAIRFPSVVFGVLVVPVLYFTGQELYDRWTGLLGAGLVAVSSFQLYFSQDARMYSLLGLLAVVSNYAFLRAYNNGDGRWFVAYVVGTTLLLYTHVLAATVVVTQAVFLGYQIVQSRPVRIRRWVGSAIAVGVLYLPWTAVIISRLTQSVGTESSLIAWNDPPSLLKLVATPVAYFGDPRVFLANPTLAVITGIAIGISSLVYLRNLNLRRTVSGQLLSDSDTFVLLWIGVPILWLAVLAYTVAPVYAVRYTIPASYGFYLVVARGVVSVDRQKLRYALGGLVLLGAIVTLPTYYGTDQKEQWQETTNLIEQSADANDLVILTDKYVKRPFGYYYSGDTTVEPIRETISRDQLHRRVKEYDTVWLVVSHVTTRNERRIVDALDDRYAHSMKREFYGVTLYRFTRSN